MHKLSKHDHVFYGDAKVDTSRKTNWPTEVFDKPSRAVSSNYRATNPAMVVGCLFLH